MWLPDDGFIHLLDDPWAPHPVANKHIMNGGGGGESFTEKTPNVPDYSAYIAQMTKLGGQGMDWANQLMDWAKKTGVDLTSIAKTVSDKAGAAADTAAGRATEAWDRGTQTFKQWQDLSTPLYQAQQADAMRMIGNLPQTEEQYAGKFGSDAAMAADQAKASAIRDMEGRGLAPNAAATGALDTMAATNRALATTAAAESGRLAARNEARTVTGQALTSEQFIPQVAAGQQQVAGQQQGIQTQNLGLQTQAPNAAASAAAGLYSPGMGMYSAAFPYMQAWGSTMANSYNQQLAGYNSSLQAFKANQEAESQGSGLSSILGLVGGIAGSYLGGPAGGMIGSKLGSIGGSAASGGYSGGPFGSTGGSSIFGGLAEGGKIRGRRIPRNRGIDTTSPMFARGGKAPAPSGPIGELKEWQYWTHPSMDNPVRPLHPEDWMDMPMPSKETHAQGGMTGGGHYVPPEASPSNGENVDDVNAMVSAGEFVVPERTVDWYGEKFFQNLINKADKEAETQTVAQGEEKPVPTAITAQPPMFRSEGART